MEFTYDAVLEHDDNGYFVSFPQFPGETTFATTREGAIGRASELLELLLCEIVDEGLRAPSQEAAIEVVPVDITGDVVSRSRCMTVDEAAEVLGITAGRVSQLASQGKLQPVVFGSKRMVTIASVNERKSNPPAPHRPRSAAKATARR